MRFVIVIYVLILIVTGCSTTKEKRILNPELLVKKATVDQRFQSYNLLMNYRDQDLQKKKLLRLASALGPFYLKVSGELTRKQRKDLIDFGKSVDAKIVEAENNMQDILHGTFSEKCNAEFESSSSSERAKYSLNQRNLELSGKPVWMSEVPDDECPDNVRKKTFQGIFRFLDQQGLLSQLDIKVIFHESFLSGNSGLIDLKTAEPRPVYWAALLWNRFMGKTVLSPGRAPSEQTKLYAHCMKGSRGGVSLLVMNIHRKKHVSFIVSSPYQMYTLHTDDPDSSKVKLNGMKLEAIDEVIPEIRPERFSGGEVSIAPQTVNFLVIPEAANQNCYFD